MTNLETLNDLLEKKVKRQTVLLKESKELEKLHLTISDAKRGRWFGSSYLFIKRILSIFIAIALITVALLVILFPSIILENQELHDSLMAGAKEHYIEITGETLSQSLLKIMDDDFNSDYSTASIIENLEAGMEKSLEKEIVNNLQFFAGLLILLAFVFLYISRTARKMKVRNQKISETETLMQDIIENFRANIQEEEQELVILQEMIRTHMKNKTTRGATNHPSPNAS